MKWEKVKLGKYVEILSGFAFKSKDFLNCGVPVIKIKNITQEGVTLEDVSYISKELADKNEKYHLNYNDILIALTGSHINQMSSVVGRIARIKYHEDSLLNQRVGKVFAKDSKVCDIDYVYYFLSQDYIKISLASKAGGAANQANISPNDVKSLTVRWPDIETQHRIADILSAYDDLIENNQKQIKLLEEAAQRLYKEWFVDLRFPGHENTKIVDGVPEGWKKNCAEKFFEITIGKTPPRTEKRCFTTGKNGIPWVSIADMGNSGMFVLNTAENLTDDAIKQYNVKVIPKNTVLLSFKLTVGRVAIAPNDICTNEAIAHFKGRRECEREYIYFYLKNFHYDELGSTSSISKAVNSKIIKAMPFIMPSEKLLKEYSSKTKDIFDLIICKQKMDNDLKIARDRILHKLMSGEMEV